MIADQFRLFILAIDRFTRFPIPQRLFDWASPARLNRRRALRFMPLCGLITGFYSALAYLMTAQILPHSVAVILAIGAGALVTGGRPETGMARFFDAVAATLSRAAATPAAASGTDAPATSGAPHSAWRIRRREPAGQRLGPGMLVLILIVGLRIEALSSTDASWLSIAMLTAQPLASGCAALLLMTAAYDAPSAGDRPVVPALQRLGDRLMALLFAASPALLVAWWFGQPVAMLAAAVPALLVSLWMHRVVRRSLRLMAARLTRATAAGGTPANGIAATQQFAEAAYYLGLLAWQSLTTSSDATDNGTSGDADGGDGGDGDDDSGEGDDPDQSTE